MVWLEDSVILPNNQSLYMPGRLSDFMLHFEPSAFGRLFFALFRARQYFGIGSEQLLLLFFVMNLSNHTGVSLNYKKLALTIHMLALTIQGPIIYT